MRNRHHSGRHGLLPQRADHVAVDGEEPRVSGDANPSGCGTAGLLTSSYMLIDVDQPVEIATWFANGRLLAEATSATVNV